jgi:hypothetical protein
VSGSPIKRRTEVKNTLPIGRIEGSKTPIETHTPLIRYFVNDIDPQRASRWLSICTAANVGQKAETSIGEGCPHRRATGADDVVGWNVAALALHFGARHHCQIDLRIGHASTRTVLVEAATVATSTPTSIPALTTPIQRNR